MNNDLISRSALLEKATNVTKYDEGGWSMDLRAVPVENVVKAPAVDAGTKWISVRDRLPKESGQVVIMTLSIIDGSVFTIANVAYSAKWKAFNAYDGDPKDFVQKIEIHPHYWMPMPEPPEEG